ncbi:MAG: peroxiredoxin [Acidobacteria bacterium]|nr:peroxiredoxin [Acidobacteriota bacterium]
MFGELLEVGTVAPDFAAGDENGTVVTLASLKGSPVVLVFYPGDDTRICTAQLCEIRDEWSAFQTLNARVFGVNGQGANSHRRFSQKFGFPFPLLADKGWRMCRAYGCGMLLVKRTVYVIGPDGRIRFAERGKPSTAAIQAAVEGSRSALTS